MFTGLIEEVGRLGSVAPLPGGAARLRIEAPGMAADLRRGESVAVDGACLTVEEISGGSFGAFASDETLARTTLGAATPGRPLNLERALRLSDRLGGHLVAGHVDATGRFVALEPRGGTEGWLLRVAAPRAILEVSVPKGSIAVDGISLTLVDVLADSFTVAVIPETFQATALRFRQSGESVNLESDLIGKYVARALGAYGGGAVSRHPGTPLEMLLARAAESSRRSENG